MVFTHTLSIIDTRGGHPERTLMFPYARRSIDWRFSSTNGCFISYCNLCWSVTCNFLRGYLATDGGPPASFMSGNMTKDSPTSKCGRRIESSPSISIYIILGVPRTLAAMYCRCVTRYLRLHYTFFRSARRHVRAEVNSSDIGLELLILLVSFLDVSATVPIVRVLKYQRFTGLDDWRGFKMMSRRRTGVAMDMVPDVLCLHHALLV